MKRTVFLSACLLAATSLWAQRPMTPPSGGKAISDHLIGIFFEDISNAADGGLYAELVQNRGFEEDGDRALRGVSFAPDTLPAPSQPCRPILCTRTIRTTCASSSSASDTTMTSTAGQA